MIRKILAFIFVISVIIPWKLSWAENYSFRHTNWGMAQEEVLAAERVDPIEKNENMVKYEVQLLGKNFVLTYLFFENRLVGSVYILDEKFLNSEHYIQMYTELKEELIKKYGQPSRETTNWANDTYKNVRKKWGLALSLGHFDYVTAWDTQNTTIDCSLSAENYNVLCVVEYWSTEYSQLAKQIKKEDKLDPF